MKISIVYTKDCLLFSEQNKRQESLLFSDDLIYSENIYKQDSSFVINEDYIIDDSSTNLSDNNKTNTVINEYLQVLQQSFYIYNPQITIQDQLSVVETKYNISDINQIVCKQIVNFKENWCNSDNYYNSNIIQYNVNSDILVNDIMYNSFNIHRYKFDVRDDFSFFIDNNKQLMEEQQKIHSVFQINGQNEQLTKNQFVSQKVQVDVKKYQVLSNIDGLIINNKIHLSVGKHNIKIKKLNTPKVFYFDIQVLSPYRRQYDKVYMLDIFDLQNAKYYSNYEIQQNQVEVFDNTITIS